MISIDGTKVIVRRDKSNGAVFVLKSRPSPMPEYRLSDLNRKRRLFDGRGGTTRELIENPRKFRGDGLGVAGFQQRGIFILN